MKELQEATWDKIKHFIDSRNVFIGQANIMMYEIGARPVPLVLLGSPPHNQQGHHWEQFQLHTQPK